jgi:hypothetical protein
MPNSLEPSGDARLFTAVTPSPAVRDITDQTGAVLLDVNNGLCLSLNAVGAKVWQMLKQGLQGDRIVAALRQEFGAVPESQLRHDYLDFLKDLESNRLVRIDRPGDFHT